MIKLSNITKVFQQGNRSIQALNDVSLHVPAGQIYGVIGASGAGKSTLIRCVNLLERPTQGSVQVGGQELTALSEKELTRARRQIGMIFQHFNLLHARSVADNVAVPLEIAKVPKAARQARVAELLELVGLADKAAAFPSQLSGGQKQRVGIARALAARPDVLLCDEATSALDPETTASVLSLLADINQKLNLTIVLITHELEVVKTLCDHAALLEHGEIIESGRIADLLVAPWSRLRQSLLHDPQAERDFLARHGFHGRPLCGVA
ncbi:ABC transporter [Klebsiella michiganensis]|uniref:ABC transporter n=1 Tax=Klebsiella michiganensis TaxID=1134687 RepID=A0A2J4Z5T7_9ENTR|nr:ABC transporter [Klebsiella michiganensis]